MAGNIDKFCDRMRYWCDSGNLGYDQGNRWDIREGGECDCSSLVYYCLWEAGFFSDKPTWGNTATLWDHLSGTGWERIANNGNPQKGDILLNDNDHVAVWLGDCLAQASIDENGNIAGGASGDQANETNTRGYYNYPWDCYLRYTGAQSSYSSSGSSQSVKHAESETSAVFKYKSYANGKWYGECKNHENDAKDGYSGDKTNPIRGIAIGVTEGTVKYRAYTKETGWLEWVNKYDPNDYENGMAGDLKHDITAIQVYWYSPTGQNYAKYASYVNGQWYEDQYDTETSNGQDGYSGDMKNPIKGFRLTAV